MSAGAGLCWKRWVNVTQQDACGLRPIGRQVVRMGETMIVYSSIAVRLTISLCDLAAAAYNPNVSGTPRVLHRSRAVLECDMHGNSRRESVGVQF